MPALPLRRLAELRASTYEALSQALLYPEAQRLAAAGETAAAAWERRSALAQLASFECWSRLLRALVELSERPQRELERAYVPLFVVRNGPLPCPPYESVYREPGGQPTGQLLSQVEGEYRAVGLTLAPASGEMGDHVAVELGYLAYLCGREGEAFAAEDLPRGLVVLEKENAFLDAHLTQWLPDFAQSVRAADEAGTYATVVERADAFVRYDLELVRFLLETLRSPAEA